MVEFIKKANEVTRSIRTRFVASIILAVLTAGTVFASSSISYSVTVYDDEQEIKVVTYRNEAEDVLAQAEITLKDGDKLDLSKFVSGKTSTITVYRAHSVVVTDSDGRTTALTVAGTVKDAIDAAGIELNEKDILNYSLDRVLTENMGISVLREMNLNIVADGQTISMPIAALTVKQALEVANITLGENDEVSPSLDSFVKEGDTIKVYRVTYTEGTVKEAVAYKTEIQKCNTMYTNESEVIQKGVNGEREVTYKYKVVDGVVSSKEELSSTTLVEPINQIKKVGTKKYYKKITLKTNSAISTLGTPDWIQFDENKLPTNYKSIIEGKAVSYTGGGHTATGKAVQPGYVAVNPNQIPYGTKMYIVSLDGSYVYGYCEAQDTGGFAKKGTYTVDLYMNSMEECRAWGCRNVRIYIF
ncbi:MAG: ubiquitin-like domain-containing protein [Clostridiales bacterium]|nr:ubiquitin-like domain-containing protein [Clostridiales bacterium]